MLISLILGAPLASDSRITDEIERSLRRGANLPRVRRNKSKVEGHKLKIREILNTLEAPSTPLDGTLSLSERVPNLAPVDAHAAATTPTSGSGTSSVLPFPIPHGVLLTFYFLNFNVPACGRLVRRAFALHELPSLIEMIFSSQDESDTIRRLLGDDAQAFVDLMDQARLCPLIIMNPC